MAMQDYEIEVKGVEELAFDTEALDSAALRRLIEEVRADELPSMHAYNRTYNRHNR
jgi:hypothetical protein